MSLVTVGPSSISWNDMASKLMPRSYSSGAISMASLASNEIYPTISNPISSLNLVDNYYYQEFIIEGTGTVDIVTPGAAAEYQNSANSYMRTKVINLNNYPNVLIRAVGTYPNYVDGFFTAANGGGDPVRPGIQPGSGDHTLDWQPITAGSGNSYASNATIYVRFVDAHNP